MWVSIKYFLASILILPCLLNGEYIYLHPKFTSSIRADPVSKYYPLISKSQELHPRLYQILNLPASHESNFYRLDGNGNPIINTDTSIASSSEIGQLEIPASMLSAYESPTVLANLFIKTHRVSVCGDGILDFGNDEKCEFVLTEMGKNSFVATTPPPNYHFQWVQDKKSIHPTQRECLWAPGRIGGCNNRASLGGIQRFHLPSPIFAHYCGDGIHDISPTHPLLQSLLEAWNQPTSEYRQFFTICGYLDEHCLLPIYCNEGSNPWIVTGKTIRFTSNSLEQCDLGDLLNGAASSGCTSECSLRCSHKHGGVVDWNDWPRLSCHQPCPDARWKGLYCDVPNCDHGIPNLHEGGCYSCENGWIGPSCSQNICGNGRIAGWDDSVAKTQRKPICICNAGWYGPACDKSYCALWDSGGKCLECISGKRDPTTYCIQDACVYGEKPPRASADGSCLQPCKVGFFSGKFCNETKCIQWERIDLTSINDIRCVKCLPGHELPNCTPSQNSNVYSRCENPWKFGYDCSQSRRKNPSTNQCIPGWIGKYCSILACTRGYPDFSHPKLHCIKGSCLPGWGGKWCEISNLILIDDLNKHQNWAKARALVYKKYVYLTQNSPLGVSLKLWRDIATAIVYGKRPTDLMAKNSINRLPDWKNLDKAIDHERVYFSEKSSWIPLKPDQQINHAIDNVKLEMGKFLQRLKSKNLYVGISSKDPNFDYDIPIQKHCEYGIPQEASKYLPCRDCAPGWFGDYCDMTNCVEFLKDNTNCTNCKPGYEGDFCLIETLKKDKNVECSNGWENPNCQIPKCLYGYRLVSPQYSRQKKLHQAVSAQNPITIDIMHLFRIERKWIKKHIPCELSASQMTTTSYDIKMHSIVKTVTNSLLCDGILIRSVEDSRCSACYPGFGGDYCTTMSNGKPIDNCTEICINGVWNWEKGYCFPCFAGFFGESCEKSHCMELSTSNYTCISCQMLNPSELDLKLRDLLKTHASPLYGQRFGDYCESRGLCLFGVQSKTDEGCLSCSSPCVTGPYCNETRCSYFSSDQIPICAVCKEGWKGVCCQESAILEEKKAVPSILDSIFNTCKSIGLVGWPQCSRNRCTYGAMNLTDREFFRCIPDSCLPGWGGPWCTFPLWESEDVSPALQTHLLNQLKEAVKYSNVEQKAHLPRRIGSWQGGKSIGFSSNSLFTDIAPFKSDPKCSLPALTGHYCNRRFCKNGISFSDNSKECEVCFPGWMGPFCNETHRRNPYNESDVTCEKGWWNPILCDKKSECKSASSTPDDDGLPCPGGVADLFSNKCAICSWPTFFKGPYCNQSTCIHGSPSLLPSSEGTCLPGSCNFGWKGHFCNESLCLHGYRILSSGAITEHNVYSYFPSQRWSYGWRGIGRVKVKSSLSNLHENSQTSANKGSSGFFFSFFNWKLRENPSDINKVSSPSKNIDDSVNEIAESPLCTECYPGYPQSPFCDQLYQDASICIHGWFDHSTGKCSDCFPGWAGPLCDTSACIKWLVPYVKFKECQSGLHGPLCEYKSLCIHGVLDRRSPLGACQAPCLFRFFVDPFCNETNCLEIGADGMPKLDSNGYCLACRDGYQGSYCTSKLSCVNGLVSAILAEKNEMCIPGTCAPGWSGPWCHKRTLFRPGSPTDTTKCEEGWIGSLCDIPDCMHGVPDFAYGWCRWCHPGWVGHACDTKPCLFGISNLLYQPMRENKSLELFSPPCIPGTCLDSWRGSDCAHPSCFGEGADSSLWNVPSGILYLLFGKSGPQRGWSSVPTFTDSPNDEAVVAKSPDILPSTDGSIPGIDWNTLSCMGCSHPYYRPPTCDRINRCLWGILDEASSDGRCVPGSCQRGGGPFCSKPICYHGIPDPKFTLGCHKCYSGWKGLSSDSKYPLVIEEDVPNVLDLSFDALPILICDTPTCINGWLHFLYPPTVDPHSYICICFDGWQGQNCDQIMEESFSNGSAGQHRPGCPEYTCPKPLDMALDCPNVNDNNSAVTIEIAPRNGCPPGTVDSLLVELFLERKNSTSTTSS